MDTKVESIQPGTAWLSYFLGLFTGIIILLIFYLFALLFPKFRNLYDKVVCSFPNQK